MGKMVLELLKYAKSAIRKLEKASIWSQMTKMEASDWWKFSNCRSGIFEQFWDHFTPGRSWLWALFKKKILKKTDFWSKKG